MALSLEDAFSNAQQTRRSRRLLVAQIDATDVRWWGGSVDDWQPDETLFSSGAALKGYRKLVSRFRKGDTTKAHVLMIHNDGTFGAVMLGIESAGEAQHYLSETLEEIRIRTSQ
jgi:hypothetical protein